MSFSRTLFRNRPVPASWCSALPSPHLATYRTAGILPLLSMPMNPNASMVVYEFSNNKQMLEIHEVTVRGGYRSLQT
jgi:hypothetical protein